MEERETIKYRDLSLYLKLASIGGFIIFVYFAGAFAFGVMLGLLSAI